MEELIKDRPQDLEVRFCCVCHKQYKYPEKDGSDLRCCSSACEEQLLDEQYDAFNLKQCEYCYNVYEDTGEAWHDKYCSQECRAEDEEYYKSIVNNDIPF